MKATIILQRIKHAIPPSLLKEALISFSFDIFGILAGFIFASYLNMFQLSTRIISLYPSVARALAELEKEYQSWAEKNTSTLPSERPPISLKDFRSLRR